METVSRPGVRLPRATLARLCPHQYLLSCLRPDPSDPASNPLPKRSNGREPHEARRVAVNADGLTHAQGSAVARTGDTTVVCGVRAETILVADIPCYRPRHAREEGGEAERAAGAADLINYRLLVPNIEMATGSAPKFMPGVPPTKIAQTLSTRVYSLLHKTGLVSIDDLTIWKEAAEEEIAAAEEEIAAAEEEIAAAGKADDDDDDDDTDMYDEGLPRPPEKREAIAFFVLYIDIFFVSFDGNAFDAAWLALLAALRNTRLPAAFWDSDRERVLCTRAQPARPLALAGFPVALTAVVFAESERKPQCDRERDGAESWLLVDPDAAEEDLCSETITVVVDKSAAGKSLVDKGKGREGESRGKEAVTRILALERSGGVCMGDTLPGDFIGIAEARWSEWAAVLEAA